MKGGDKKQTVQQTNTYAWQNPPETGDVKAIRDWKPEIDPGLGYGFARARRALAGSFNDPMGAYTTPAVRDAQFRSGNERLAESEAEAFRGGQYDVNNQELAKLETVANMTNPRLVQSGGTQVTTMPQPSIWPQIIGGAAGVGAAAL